MGNMRKSFFNDKYNFLPKLNDRILTRVLLVLHFFFNTALATNIAEQSYFYLPKHFIYNFMDFFKNGNSFKGCASLFYKVLIFP